MGSSTNDIVKYAATVYMERQQKGHNKWFVGVLIVASLALLFFQCFLVVSLNQDNMSLLFCGDVISKIETDSDDAKILFRRDSVQSFNRTWYAKANMLQSQFIGKVNRYMDQTTLRLLNQTTEDQGDQTNQLNNQTTNNATEQGDPASSNQSIDDQSNQSPETNSSNNQSNISDASIQNQTTNGTSDTDTTSNNTNNDPNTTDQSSNQGPDSGSTTQNTDDTNQSDNGTQNQQTEGQPSESTEDAADNSTNSDSQQQSDQPSQQTNDSSTNQTDDSPQNDQQNNTNSGPNQNGSENNETESEQTDPNGTKANQTTSPTNQSASDPTDEQEQTQQNPSTNPDNKQDAQEIQDGAAHTNSNQSESAGSFQSAEGMMDDYDPYLDDQMSMSAPMDQDTPMIDEMDVDIDKLTLQQLSMVQATLQRLYQGAKMEFIGDLALNWKSSKINSHKCRAIDRSEQNQDDLKRQGALIMSMRNKFKQDKYKTNQTIENLWFDQGILNQMTADQKNNTWVCPKQWRNQKGTCRLDWQCSLQGWKSFCSNQMTFASTIPGPNIPAWLAGVIILAISVTADVYNHLLVMRQVPFFFKLLLIIQSSIAINIAILNASLTAGQATPVDILMNSLGLLIINEMDNIIGSIFVMLRTKQEAEQDLLFDGIEWRDQIFARMIAFPHLILTLLYTLWFLGAFQFQYPEQGLTIFLYYHPYSPFFFWLVVMVWYLICFNERCESIRCESCFQNSDQQYQQKQAGETFDQDIEVAPVGDQVVSGLVPIQGNHNGDQMNRYTTPNGSQMKMSESDYAVQMQVSPDPIMIPALMVSDRSASTKKPNW